MTEAGQDRLHSLDAFRGATIAAMLFVNNPGSWSNVYSPFRHAEWHGCTPTDLVFPFFLFIVGVSMAFSLRAYMGPGRKPGLPSRVFRRVTMLILLGLFLNGFPSFDLDTIRLPGVLQRIGLVYAMAVPLVMLLGARGLVGVSAGILLGYWAVLGLVPVEGVSPAWNPVQNLSRQIDLALIGSSNLWQGGPTDPEGLLGTLPALVTCLMGYGAGRLLLREEKARMCAALILFGLGFATTGLLWGLVLPINKTLWTPSFVLLSGGVAMICLAIASYFIDVRRMRTLGMPFESLGINAITAFVLSALGARLLTVAIIPGPHGSMTARLWLYEGLQSMGFRPADASMIYAAAVLFFWWCVIKVLHQLGWKWRV